MEKTLKKVSRYWHTLRHLKAEQILFQLWRRVWHPKARRGVALSERAPASVWTAPIPTRASFAPPDRFEFLGQAGHLSELGWDGAGRDKLWRYNQHYFGDLLAADAAQRSQAHHALIADWIAANPPGQGTGWEPYPTSLRIVAWIKWALAGQGLSDAARASLADQARWLTRNLERHILGNHLLANAKALVFAGLYFEGPEARNWRRLGLRILDREIPEQILPDGGHFELSPMYHIVMLEDVLDLINLTRCLAPVPDAPLARAVAQWEARVPDMLRWMALLSHPDGEIAFFNDATIGIAPPPAAARAYAARLGLSPAETGGPGPEGGALRLPDSGYARLECGPAVLLADTAPVGPDYLPGHAHADSLSFELSLKGRRLIVNSGTSVYGSGAERLRQRGTEAHSTLVLDGEDSSEVWGGFRVARRARILDPRLERHADRLMLEAGHDGYARLPGAPRHHRQWELRDDSLLVRDRVHSPRKGSLPTHHRAEVIFLLTPEWQAQSLSARNARLTGPDGNVQVATSAGTLLVEPGSWHPGFGRHEPCTRLRVQLEGALPLDIETRLTWEP
ncbi:hypothetical protein BV394_16160 (plasmid) [Brevirhabdus pacifica]|uniref:Uncharacterized protein n=1 Tax=Brevirhabdus pacifica TaxID=1267768 RepID=A0A1P8QYH5_9RHOB|nr:heparinase II/III family protein [Brevirhabdus pacifica]APX91422.1 hypothetical protein BV394_16160 [Brevirhabdus pacifica]PJJ78976.1 putative heparinase superfamily protein [Brevirhabdus pacifica]